jgi:hypothetical protein
MDLHHISTHKSLNIFAKVGILAGSGKYGMIINTGYGREICLLATGNMYLCRVRLNHELTIHP